MQKSISRECEECGEQIASKRLTVQPNAMTCISCQEGLEKTGQFQLHRMDVRGKERCGEIDSVETILYRATQ